MMKQAKFDIGQIVRHAQSGHRGVVVDIDPEFAANSDDTVPTAYRRSPWYHVLLDDQNLQAYIVEQELQRDTSMQPINHAFVEVFFSGFDKDHYISRRALN